MVEKFELNVAAFGGLSDEEFFHFCRDNDDLRIERNADGKMIIIPPVGSLMGNRSANLAANFGIWNREYRKGYFFGSLAGFTLPDGSTRSPDVLFILKNRWEVLSRNEQEVFAPICPDFVIELRSKNDSLKELQKEMREYLAHGTTFGWLIDSYERKVHIYDAQQGPEVFDNFSQPLQERHFMDSFEITLSNVLT